MRLVLLAIPFGVFTVLAACSSDDASSSSSSSSTSSGGSSGAASSSGATSSSGGSSSGHGGHDGGEEAGSDASDGGDAGPPSCNSFCNGVQAICTGQNQVYDDLNACLTACVQWTVGSPSDMSGDTFYCREYHRQLAVGDPVGHCAHTKPLSAVCN